MFNLGRGKWGLLLVLCLGSVSGEMAERPFLDWDSEEGEVERQVGTGQDMELECAATGSPPPTIQWFRDGKALISNPSAVDEAAVGSEVEQVANQGMPTIQTATTQGRIFLPCVGEEASGHYSCVASNGVAPPLSRNTTLKVTASNKAVLCPKSRRARSGVAPRIEMWTDMRLERADAVAQLFCRASGFPTPRMAWYLLDEDLETRTLVQPSKHFIFLRNGDLMVREPPAEQGGFSFLCEARNPFGVDSKVITLVEVDYDIDETTEAKEDES